MNIKEKIFDLLGLYIERQPTKDQILNSLKNLLPFETNHKLIRLGEESDGGYLIPDDLEAVEFCYSCGVGYVTEFEKQLYQKYSIKSVLIDPNNLPQNIFPKKAKYYQKYLDFVDSEKNMHINNFLYPEPKNEIILKVDIEGDEYENFISLSDNYFKKIRILVIELHDLRNLRSKFFRKIFDKIFKKLNKHFVVCHLHPNNTSKVKNIRNIPIPDMVELTLINKKRLNSIPKKIAQIPNILDKKTDPNKQEIYIDKKWYS